MEKTRKNTKSYQCMRFKNDTATSYSELKAMFEYEPKCFSLIPQPKAEEDYYTRYAVGWSISRIKIIVDDIINNSDYNLICVSEDANSMTYHFIKN